MSSLGNPGRHVPFSLLHRYLVTTIFLALANSITGQIYLLFPHGLYPLNGKLILA